MSSATSTLPAGWSSVLDEMSLRLDHAIASASARLENFAAAAAEEGVRERRAEIAGWCERLKRLADFLESAEQTVQSVDEVLLHEESRLRQQTAASAALRQKLAAEAGRAIG